MVAKTKPRKRDGYYWVSDGEEIPVVWRNYREQCCDCGLVHRMSFRVVDGKLYIRTHRDRRATAAARKGFRFQADAVD